MAVMIGLAPQYLYAAEKEKSEPTNTNASLFKTLDEQKEALKDYPILFSAGFDAFKNQTDDGTYIIPGLLHTQSLSKEGKVSECDEMTPQGVAVVDDYIMISAYCYEHEHNSVIYVLDRKNHNYLKTLVLNGMPHAGSIAYDPLNRNLWIATKDEKRDRGALSYISLAKIDTYDFAHDKRAILYDYTLEIPTLKDVSFMTYYKNQVFCGYFSADDKNLKVYTYDIDPMTGNLVTNKHHTAIAKGIDHIGNYCQGIAINDEYIVLAASDGPDLQSKLSFYSRKENYLLPNTAEQVIDLPPRLEQIYFNGGNTLILNFESAAKHYRDEGIYHIDRLLSLNVDDLMK